MTVRPGTCAFISGWNTNPRFVPLLLYFVGLDFTERFQGNKYRVTAYDSVVQVVEPALSIFDLKMQVICSAFCPLITV